MINCWRYSHNSCAIVVLGSRQLEVGGRIGTHPVLGYNSGRAAAREIRCTGDARTIPRIRTEDKIEIAALPLLKCLAWNYSREGAYSYSE
jgi:hypothetical protein